MIKHKHHLSQDPNQTAKLPLHFPENSGKTTKENIPVPAGIMIQYQGKKHHDEEETI